MFDVSSVSKRYFELKINGIVYKVEPCKVKLLKRLSAINAKSEDSLNDLVQVLKEVIDKNLDDNKIGMDILDDLNQDEIMAILMAYMEWMSDVKNSPNL